MIDEKEIHLEPTSSEDWKNAKCDKYDYLIAAFCGGIAGLVDVLFVGDPLSSALKQHADKAADYFIMRSAQFFWKNDQRTIGKSREMPQNLTQCISYLEQAFPVNYDARYANDLLDLDEGILGGMTPRNHHLLALAHSPDVVGLIFSIVNQFMGYATFVDKGKLIHAIPRKSSGAIPYMQGSNLLSMLFCGFVNWIGHIISDIGGSSSTRRKGNTRGIGVPIPFYEMFLFCNFGDIDGKAFSETMITVFEEGYDFRFGAAMAIPVILEELSIRVIWVIRQKFGRGKSWRECIPSKQHADLRIMLIVGNATLCLVDGVDAAARGILSGGNLVTFICRLNLVAWVRLVILVLRELRIRYGSVVLNVLGEFLDSIFSNIETPEERRLIQNFYARMDQLDTELYVMLQEFVSQVEREYTKRMELLNASCDESIPANERANKSVELAQACGVDENRIIHSIDDLDKFIMG